MRLDNMTQEISTMLPPLSVDGDFDICFADEDFDQELYELDVHVSDGHLPVPIINFGNVAYTS